METAHLQLESIAVNFPSVGGAVTALQDVCITVPKGQWVIVVGGNGSGKTTLLNVISGSVEPTCGQVIIDSKPLNDIPAFKRFRRIGRVYQNPLDGTAPTLSVFENFCLAARRSHPPSLQVLRKKSLREQCYKMLAEFNVGLEARLDDPVGVLSGGLRQCLSVVMASLGDVEMLLLDEHVAALDSKTTALALRGTEKLITKMRLTTIMVVHDLDVAVRFGHRILVLRRGCLVLDMLNGDHHLQKDVIKNAL